MRPSERLTAVVLVALAAAALAAGPASRASALGFLGLLAATALLAAVDPRSRAGAFVRDFFPVVTVVAVFMLLAPVIAGLNPRRFDALFAAVDARWFPALVPRWRNAFGRAPWFTDLAYLAYVSYYAMPIRVALLARRHGPWAYEAAVFPIVLAFYASYAGYLLFPTSGPRLSPGDAARLVGGGQVSDLVRSFLLFAERTQLDAFPSGHAAVAIVSAAVGARLAPARGPAFLAWAGAVVFSTVYIHVHYAVDVVAGAVLAAAVIAGAPALARALSRRGGAAAAPR
jgi:membrane-associated phospholipid phosphatase